MHSLIEQLPAVAPATVTTTFIYVMCTLALLAVALRVADRLPALTWQLPSLLTALGILGTFTGIVLGLSDFRLSDIDASIENLMEGLKTAFLTSIVGLALSILLNFVLRAIPAASDRRAVTFEHLHESLEGLRSDLGSISLTIGNATGKAMTHQLATIVDQFDGKLNQHIGAQLNHFTDRLDALVPALDESCQRYAQHGDRIKAWGEEADLAVQRLAQAQNELAQLHDKIAQLPQLNAQIGDFVDQRIEQADQIIALLDSQRGTEKSISQLVAAMPDHLQKVTDSLESQQQLLGSTMQGLHKTLSVYQQQFEETIHSVVDNLAALKGIDPDALRDAVQGSAQQYRDHMRELASTMAATHKDLQASLSQVIRNDLQQAELSVGRHYDRIDGQMSQEVERVLVAMGEALATISGRFTRDYQRLIDQMQHTLVETVADETH